MHADSGESGLPRGAVSPRLPVHTRIEHGLRARMRDGVDLAVDLVRPDLLGPRPVVLTRTPYDKTQIRTQRESFLNFEGMRQHCPDKHARCGQKLIIGPWPHAINRKRGLNGIDFGEHALVDLDNYLLRFFDRYLRGERNGIEDEPAAHVFLLGANTWLALPDWPPPSKPTSFYLHSRGRSNTLLGDGVLCTEPPDSEPEDCYDYDPLDPVRTSWSIHEGPVDDRLPAIRSDVLCYTSEPLIDPLDVIGWASVRLFASSSAVDTDWDFMYFFIDERTHIVRTTSCATRTGSGYLR